MSETPRTLTGRQCPNCGHFLVSHRYSTGRCWALGCGCINPTLPDNERPGATARKDER